jgi:uncharacterized protein (DUF1501 family)
VGRNHHRLGGEFGRTPTSEGVGKPGRDHDWLVSMWLAGAVKGGQAIGARTRSAKAVDEPCHVEICMRRFCI